MNLYLHGHAFKYAAEQMMVTLFPGEKPFYPRGAPAGDCWAELAVKRGNTYATTRAVLYYGGNTYRASTRTKTLGLEDGIPLERALQKALKLAFYRAGTAALGQEPPWGALTGVRPVKIPTKILLAGGSEAEAEAVLRDTFRVTDTRRALAMDCARASVAAQRGLREDEVSLYVGIPFCPSRCVYCSFVSADVGRTLKLVEPFLAALFRELQAAGAALRQAGRFVRTVYIGGGTPTTLTAPQLTALMGEIAAHIDLSRCTEYTVEAGRPDTITPEKLAAIRAGGGGRVSVNPQTMHDSVLAAMGRAHSTADILAAYAAVRRAGIPCVNMDLIAGLPADSVEGFCSSLEQVLALAPENITVHTLALKKGSRLLARKSPDEADDCAIPNAQAVSAMLDFAWQTLRGAGYTPYYLYRQKYMSGSFENVGWAKAGQENLYNIAMMEELHSVVAVGGGGITKLVDTKAGRVERIADPKYPYEYLSGIEKIVAGKARLTEFVREGI